MNIYVKVNTGSEWRLLITDATDQNRRDALHINSQLGWQKYRVEEVSE